MILGVLDDILDRPTNQKVGLIILATFLIGALDWQFWYGPQSEHLSELRTRCCNGAPSSRPRRSRPTHARKSSGKCGIFQPI